MALIVDDLLLAPAHGIMWVFRQIHKAALEAQAARKGDIRNELSEMYQALSRGEMTDEEFDQREAALLDELEAIQEEEAARQD